MTSRAQPQRFSPLRNEDEHLNRVQGNVERSIDSILQCPLIGGVLLRDVVLVYGERNDVEHKLGRKPRGWIATRLQARHSAFYAYRAGSSQNIPDGENTVLQFETELYDDGSDYDVSTYAFTAPVAGRYAFDGLFALASPDASARFGCQLYVNTSAYLGSFVAASDPSSTMRVAAIRGELRLSEGDTVSLRGYHDSAAAKNMVAASPLDSYLAGRIIGDPAPYEDTTVGSSYDRAKWLPVRAERSSTVDLWVF